MVAVERLAVAVGGVAALTLVARLAGAGAAVLAAFLAEGALLVVVEAAAVASGAAFVALAHAVHLLVLSFLQGAQTASFGAEMLVVALEYDVFAELALDGPVEDGDFHRRGESDFVDKLVLGGDNPGVIPLEHVFELLAYKAVQSLHVVGADALAVGGIGHQDATLGGLVPLREGTGVELDHAAHTGAADVLRGDINGAGRHIGADDLMGELAFAGVVVVEAVEKLGVEVLPVLEGEVAAVDTRVDVCGDEGGLDEERAGAAHRVDQRAVAPPAAFEDDACGEHLVDRGLGLGHAVAPLVERLAGGVEREGHPVAGDVHVDHHVGVLEAHSGALVVAVAVLEPVDDGILHAVCNEPRVGELVAEGHGVDRESGAYRHQRAPVELLGAVIQLVGVDGCEFENRFEDAQGGAAA